MICSIAFGGKRPLITMRLDASIEPVVPISASMNDPQQLAALLAQRNQVIPGGFVVVGPSSQFKCALQALL